MKAKQIGLVVILVVIAYVIWLTQPRRHPTDPLKLSFWFWQTPYTLSPTEQKTLKEIGVQQMFVRAGTFSSDGTNLILRFPQKFTEGSNALPIHIVFNADAGVLRHFEDYDLKIIVPQIAERMDQQVKAAERAGVKVIGVQLDFDVATRLLPRYSELITKVRAANPLFKKREGFYFSMTGLMSWLGTSSLQQLSNEVDFMVPQAYEGITGKSPDEMRPVFDPDDLKRRLPQAERLNCLYWIGVPAYGHALLYDDHGHLIGTYRNLEAQDALRHPSFRTISAYPSDRLGKRATEKDWVGEEILKLKAIKPAASGYGLGFTLAYSLPSPKALTKAIDLVKEGRGSNCQGVIIYRMPEPGSSYTVPLETIQLALNGQEVKQDIKVDVTFKRATFEAVETTKESIPIDAFVEVTNVGLGSSFVAPQSLDIRLEFDKPGFGEVRLRDFDTITFGNKISDLTEAIASPNRATTIHLTKGFSYPAQKLYCGPIRLLNPNTNSVKIKSRIRLQSGVSWQESPTREALIPSDAGNHR